MTANSSHRGTVHTDIYTRILQAATLDSQKSYQIPTLVTTGPPTWKRHSPANEKRIYKLGKQNLTKIVVFSVVSEYKDQSENTRQTQIGYKSIHGEHKSVISRYKANTNQL